MLFRSISILIIPPSLRKTIKFHSVSSRSFVVYSSLTKEFLAEYDKKLMQERDAAEEINRNTEAEITFQSAWNVVQKFGEKQ